MHGPLWDKVSSEAKELIQHLMAFDPGARLTVDKARPGRPAEQDKKGL